MDRTLPYVASAAEEAARELPDVEALITALQRYCLSLTQSAWDAEDLAQDTWVKALDTLLGPGHRNAEAYLLQIAKHAWIDRCRRNKLQKRKMLLLEQPYVTEADNGPFETEQAFEVLAQWLTPLQRAVFLLREVFGCPIAETAKRLRTTEGAVKAALHRARQALDKSRNAHMAEEAPGPADEGLRSLVFAMAAAYRHGDIDQLVALAQQDVLPPVEVYAAIQQRTRARQQNDRQRFSPPTAQMSA